MKFVTKNCTLEGSKCGQARIEKQDANLTGGIKNQELPRIDTWTPNATKNYFPMNNSGRTISNRGRNNETSEPKNCTQESKTNSICHNL